MAIYTSKFTQQEIDDGIDNANSALQPTALDNYYDKDATDDFFDEKQDTLVSGTNIKTVNNKSLLGSGNVSITKSDVGLGNVGNFKAVSTVASQGLSDTEKTNARSNIGAGTSSFSGSYNDLMDKPTIPTVNNGKFSIKGAGTEVASTTANASSASSVDIVAGNNVTVTPEATNKKITIAAKDTTYGVVSTSANGLAPKVTDTSKFLKGDGTWATPTDTNNRKSFYGTCDTAADTAEKAVTISDTAGWELKAGTIVGVKFTNTNSASNVTLNVNSSGAKSIWYNNAAYTGNSSSICGYAGRVTYYMYDGTQWVWLNMGTLDGNTDTKVKQTVTKTASDYEVLFSYTADNTTRTEGARKNSNLKFNPSTGNLQATQLNGVTIGSSPKFTDTTYSVMGGSGASHASGLVPDPGASAGTTKYLREDGTWQEVYTREEIDQKLAFSYDPATKGMVFPTDTSIVEYDATTKGMIFH